MSGAALLNFPLRGQLEPTDFLLLVDMIGAQAAFLSSPRVLLDWSEVTSWKFGKPSERQLRRWQNEARVDRLAIVHNTVGNRQAALLAAVFRRNRCQVRSYRIADRDKAIDWLTSKTP